MIVRLEQPEDYNSILRLTYEAFLTLDFIGRRRMDEHYLVSLLRGSDSVIRELCFVAELDGEIVGHILYTRSEVLRSDGTKTPTITFGPLSVHPKYHRQGIGSALVRHSLDVAQKSGYSAVLIVGVPDYYPKLGFKRAREYGLYLSDGSAPDAFMAYELVPNTLNGGGELVLLAQEYEKAESDDKGFEIFHRKFMNEYYKDQLIIRPLFDDDIALLKRWLYQPHVASWYEKPEDWLHEVRNRHGEFSFIKHFIAEIDGTPIGFCQYYNSYFEHEPDACPKHEKIGEVYSIDYLIGEPEYLHKGYGKEMLRILTSMVSSLNVKKIIVAPEDENTASKRVLEANGYIRNGEDYIMEFEKA